MMNFGRALLAFALLPLTCGWSTSHSAAQTPVSSDRTGIDDLVRGFAQPPDSARPWVYWFWLNGNITRKGITADLEAMKRVGIGGVLIMEVDQGAPVGPVDFMSANWQDLFQHVHREAQRLGLQVNMNNDAGWNGSGGPWISAAQSMQKVVWSEIEIEGPQRFEGTLPPPETVRDFYRDICAMAFPTTGPYRIERIREKAMFRLGGVMGIARNTLPANMRINRSKIVMLTQQMAHDGRLAWDVPKGKWTIVRFGHTSTGVENAPAPASGRGLECDKLSKQGIEANFAGMMAKLAADNETQTGGTTSGLVATHIDSWENGSQNWTAKMREEFQHRRGYDLLPFLPVMTGRVVGTLETSERFLWDLRQTISEMVIENYAGHMHQLAAAHGMRFTVEAYGSPCDSLPYAGRSDEPMGEFWTPSGAIETCKTMASAAHVYGKKIVGAEAFTSGDQEKWREHPAELKALGDRVLCEGINRFVFHRYALQPWDNQRVPGMTMGPWGQHYERTQTWWEWTPAWHTYLTRCQYLLRQGLFVADVCYVLPEAPPQGPRDYPRRGYAWDECPAEVVLTRMSVKNDRVVLPDGMSYRLLVLPDLETMTPQLLRKVKDLVAAGATVLGPRPVMSPSLSNYPNCDVEIKNLSDELWGDCDGQSVKQHNFGKGRVVCGLSPEKVLQESGLPADFNCDQPLHYIHRQLDDTDIYFVANPHPYELTATCSFRVTDKTPEFWWPESGRMEHAPVYREENGVTHVALPLPPIGSVCVVFRSHQDDEDPVVELRRDGKPLVSATPPPPAKVVITKAKYGVLDDPQRTRDVRGKLQRLVDAGQSSFRVAQMAEGDDPAFLVVKTLDLEFTMNGQHRHITGTDPETINLVPAVTPPPPVAVIHADHKGQTVLEVREPGHYKWIMASKREQTVNVSNVAPPVAVDGPWQVHFPSEWGAPSVVTLDELLSWTEHSDPGVKYFSGTATYRKTLTVPDEMLTAGNRLYLDLGNVQVMARVTLNDHELNTLWKPPFRVDITDIAGAGDNMLQVQVVNLWPNRMIGDEQLEEDSDRNSSGTLKAWPRWLTEGKPSPTGRHTFTSWRLWKKQDALLPSGLLGPVALQVTRSIRIQNDTARQDRTRAAKMPTITAPVLFCTPEADAICSALQVFPPDNPWNQTIDKWPLHPNSEAIITSIGKDKPLRYNPDMGFVLVPPSQERVDVKIVAYPGESDSGPYPVPSNVPIEGWPVHYDRSLGKPQTLEQVQRRPERYEGDRHAIIVDPVNRMLYEFFVFGKADNTWAANQASIFDLKTNRLRPLGWTSSDAAGLPIFPAVVRHDDIQRGIVQHAMRVTVRKSRRAFVAPATHYASSHDNPEYPRMGERIRLKADFDISSFSPAVKAILMGLKKYGMFVADNGIDWAISVTPDPRIPDLHAELRRVRGSDFEVVIAPQ